MIRKFQESDLDEVAAVWLDTNIEAHSFIPAEYWQSNFEMVKGMFLQAEMYICENEETNKIQGFIGLDGSYIAGIFIRKEFQSQGIGKQLLDFVKEQKPELSLNVYKKNVRAVKFYCKENFKICHEDTELNTGEKEYIMKWKQSDQPTHTEE